jgi:hypothetical protein
MKKRILVFITILGAAINLNAQNIPKETPPVKYGFKGGYNLTNVEANERLSTKPISGIHIGAFVEIPISRKFSIQTEILYSNQGYKEKYQAYASADYGSVLYNFNEKLHINYVNIPVLVKYNFTESLSMELGPQLGFLTKAKLKGDATTGSVYMPDFSYNEDATSLIKNFEVAVAFGITYSFSDHIFASLRLNSGVTNIFKGNDVPYNITNAAMQLSVGYKF